MMTAENVHESEAAMTDGEELSTGKKWMLRARRTVREFLNDQCIDTAAALTYFAVLSLFPMVIATFSLLGLLGQAVAEHSARRLADAERALQMTFSGRRGEA